MYMYTLFPVQKSQVLIEFEAGWVLEHVWMGWQREESHNFTCRKLNPDRPDSNLILISNSNQLNRLRSLHRLSIYLKMI